MKMRPVGAELLHEEGQTDMTKLTVAFSSSANAPKSLRCLMKPPVHSGRIKICECRLDM